MLKIALSSLFALAIAAAPAPSFDEPDLLPPLPVVAIDAKPYGIDIVSSDGNEYEVLSLVLDQYAFAMVPDPVTATECANLATVTCGAAGVAWLRYRYNQTTGEYVCEFGCNTTGTGG